MTGDGGAAMMLGTFLCGFVSAVATYSKNSADCAPVAVGAYREQASTRGDGTLRCSSSTVSIRRRDGLKRI